MFGRPAGCGSPGMQRLLGQRPLRLGVQVFRRHEVEDLFVNQVEAGRLVGLGAVWACQWPRLPSARPAWSSSRSCNIWSRPQKVSLSRHGTMLGTGTRCRSLLAYGGSVMPGEAAHGAKSTLPLRTLAEKVNWLISTAQDMRHPAAEGDRLGHHAGVPRRRGVPDPGGEQPPDESPGKPILPGTLRQATTCDAAVRRDFRPLAVRICQRTLAIDSENVLQGASKCSGPSPAESSTSYSS